MLPPRDAWFAVAVERLGWVLVHSLWQFCLVALVAIVLQRALQRKSAALRYTVLLSALAIAMLAPLGTWCVLPAPMDSPRQVSSVASALPVAEALSPADPGWTSSDQQARPEVLAGWRTVLHNAVRPWLVAIVLAWAAGVLAFAVRPLFGWYMVGRLRTIGVQPVSQSAYNMLRRCAERLQVRRPVEILQSALVRAPAVVGWFRPAILLPPSVLTGLPTAHLEAILAHELAHIRRHDYLVNLLQTLAETVFFYHPAVWWLSHQIRNERESCCDDIVVAMTGNRVDYGRALLSLEELRGPRALLFLGAGGGSLLARIRRLLQTHPAQRNCTASGMAAAAIFLILAGAIGILAPWRTPAPSQAAAPRSPVDASGDQIVRIADSQYVRPTAKDQKALAQVPAEAWGEPVDGLRVAIIPHSSHVDKNDLFIYDIAAENVSDRDIRFSARVGNRWLGFCQLELFDAGGKEVPPQEGMREKWRPHLIRIWLKPGERTVISPWNTQLVRVAQDGQTVAAPRRHYGHPFFKIAPGEYTVSARVELGASTESRDPASGKRTVLSPAQGEFSGKLKTGAVAVELFTDAGG